MIRRQVKLNLKQGLHIRACSKVVALVTGFSGQIRIHYQGRAADASSMFDLVQLAALPGSDLILEGDGDGADSIIDSLEELLSAHTEPED